MAKDQKRISEFEKAAREAGEGKPLDDVLRKLVKPEPKKKGGTLAKRRPDTRTRCLVPRSGDTFNHHVWREGLWARFYTAAPARRRWSVERYSGVKKA
jgi:hypothetical protein